MVINLVLVAGTVVLSLIGDPTTTASPTHAVTPRSVKVAATVDSFSPPPKAKKRRPASPRPPSGAQPDSSGEDEVDEDQPATRRPPATTRRKPAVEEMESEAGADEEEEDEEEKPRTKKKSRKRVAEEEEEEEEEDAPMASLPVVLPHVISVYLGASAIGRSFAYNTALQKESTFPRAGIGLGIEAYPMLRMPRGWHRKLGVGFTMAMEFGAAAFGPIPADGGSYSFPVAQRRWALDVRYVIPAGERVVIVPTVGYGSNTFDLKTRTPMTPTMCGNDPAIMKPCIADVQASYAVVGGHIRIAATEAIALSLSGGYFLGIDVGKGIGQIGVESTETKVAGFQVEPGVTIMLKDWLAIRASIPVVRYGYAFTSQMAVYKTAAETYYGVGGGAVILMP